MFGISHAPELRPRTDPPPSMIERMTLIMEAFTSGTTRLPLEEVARRTSLPRSTAHRILDQLVRFQWVEHTSAGYGLGRRALGLGCRDGGHGEIREAAAPILHDLQLATGLVVHLGILEGDSVRYLDKAGGRFARSVPSRVGGRAPARTTALGRAMLAWLKPEQVDVRLGDPGGLDRPGHPDDLGHLGHPGHPGHSGHPDHLDRSGHSDDLGELHQELHRIRQRHGLAFERGECFAGIASVAAAIRGHEGPPAGIALAGDVRTPLETVAPLVADAARRASLALTRAPRPRDGETIERPVLRT